MASFNIIYNILSICHCKYSSIWYHFRVIWHWRISLPCLSQSRYW